MGFMIREIARESKFCRELTLTAVSQAVPEETIAAVIQDHGVRAPRERKLNMVVVVWLVIAMHLYTSLALGHVLQKLAQGLCFIWPDPLYPVPKDSAITCRRYQLGARAVVDLFHRVCRPLATPQTAGAFLFGLRLMAIDGTVEDAPDTPATVAAFGRHRTDRGASAFAQIQGVYLVECGTHAIVDAGFWPCHVSERVGGKRLLRSVEAGMLVMWDRGLHDYDMIQRVRQRQSHVLCRVPVSTQPQRLHTLPDGSFLAAISPGDKRRRCRERLVVRVIDYALNDPGQPGYGERHRLYTTLLDPQAYPALALVCAYHERWEIEVTIDEVDTHQRLAGRPLRSLKPVGIIQELYGLLIAHYAVRFLMHAAALQTGIDPDRLSFVHALRVIRAAVAEFQMVAPEQVPPLYARLLHGIAQGRIPERRLRSYPRLVKRKMSKFNLKRSEHRLWPQPTVPFRKAVTLI